MSPEELSYHRKQYDIFQKATITMTMLLRPTILGIYPDDQPYFRDTFMSIVVTTFFKITKIRVVLGVHEQKEEWTCG